MNTLNKYPCRVPGAEVTAGRKRHDEGWQAGGGVGGSNGSNGLGAKEPGAGEAWGGCAGEACRGHPPPRLLLS